MTLILLEWNNLSVVKNNVQGYKYLINHLEKMFIIFSF